MPVWRSTCGGPGQARQGHQFPIVDGASGLFVVAPQIPFPPSIAAKKFLAERPSTTQPKGLAPPANAGASEIASGLTAVIDLAFGHHGKLYALVMGNGQGSGFPDPEAGRVVRVHPNGREEVVLTGLTFPTGLTFGRDRRLYISNKGFEIPSKGTGEIHSKGSAQALRMGRWKGVRVNVAKEPAAAIAVRSRPRPLGKRRRLRWPPRCCEAHRAGDAPTDAGRARQMEHHHSSRALAASGVLREPEAGGSHRVFCRSPHTGNCREADRNGV